MDLQDRIMDGNLRELGLQSVLKMLALGGKTGKLFVNSGPETLSISLRKGQIVGLHEEGTPGPDLVGMLCLLNKLDLAQVSTVRERAQGNMQHSLAILGENGWMSAQEVQQRLEFAVTQAISHSLPWTHGRFSFHRILPIDSVLRPLDVDSVTLEALRQADEWERVAKDNPYRMTKATVVRWLSEVSRDVGSLGLTPDCVEVLCLCNGEFSLQALALALMLPEARIALQLERLLQLRLIEIVDTALETELSRDLSNIIIKGESTLVERRGAANAVQHLHGLLTTLSECINALLIHHGSYAKSLRGRGQLPPPEIVRYLENRFGQHLRTLAKGHYSILDTASFHYGQLDCTDILTLHSVVKGEQLEEFYWEAVQGLAVFLHTLWGEVLQDEVGNSHMGRQLKIAWKIFHSEIENGIRQYQFYRAQHKNQKKGNEYVQSVPLSLVPNRVPLSQPYHPSRFAPETQPTA